MAAVSLCPDAQTLQRFLLGQNTADEADTLEQHLEQCERCLSALHTLAGRDSVVEAIQSQSGAEADSPAIRGLAERLKQLRPVDEASTRTQAHTSEAATLPPRTQADAPEPQGHGASSEEIYDFLAPGQNPDELGRLGHYRVRRVLGSGGMGVVFQAFDPHLERLVALKAMLPAMAASASAKQRFLREAKAAAAIKHDHIVTIYQVGEDRGAPFLAMEFLEGESLEERLKREARLPVPDVLRIGREIAEGLAAAHQRGLIHRDIKPGNVWLEERGAPSAERAAQAGTRPALHAPRSTRVKILDFGLARAVADQAHLTQAGAIIGTPAFMAPEQVGGQAVDARCDLFSLGCVLYRMATGELPFKGKDTIPTLMAVASAKARPPQELNPQLPAVLCTLIERLLAKRPDERPTSAAAVVDEIEAIERADAPATPAPQPLARRRLPRPLVAAAVLLGILGVAGYLFGPVVVRYVANEGEVVIVIDDPRVQAVVDQTGVTIRDREKQREYKVKPGRHDLKTGEYVLEVTEVGGDVRLFTKEFTISRGGKTSVKVTFDPKARVDESTANAVSWAEVLPAGPNCLAVSPKGRLVAVGGGMRAGDKYAMLSLWDLQRRQVSYRLDGHPDQLWAVAFSPDGRLVVSGSQGELRPEYVQKPRGVIHPRLHLWNAQTGGKIRELPGHTSTISSVVFTPEGRIVSGAWDNTIRLWTTTGEPIKTIDVKNPVLSLAVFPGGERCLFGSVDDKLRVIDMVTGKQLDEVAGPKLVESLAIASDGRKAFSCGHDGTVRVFDFTTGQERRFLGHVGPVLTLALSSDNRRLLSGGDDKVIPLWDVETGAQIASLEGHTARVRSVIFLPGDRRALSAGWDSTLRLWSLPEAVSPAPPTKKEK